MKSVWDIPFIIVDVETTGYSAEIHRVMEIACITMIGGEIVNEFSSLVNPHQYIPKYISKMTGISNEQVYAAPEVEEVFNQVFQIMMNPDAVFVAHNAGFDWSFVASSFALSNLEIPVLKKLDTLKLARRLLTKSRKKM